MTRRQFVQLTALGSGVMLTWPWDYKRGGSMEKVKSADGTLIAYRRTGSGPPLVLVHGTTADHTRWASVSPALEQHFTVCSVDRRGRGESGDSGPYHIQREFEDVAAVVGSIGQPVYLLGHSYGAICSLEASLLAGNISKLILYEPPIPTGIPAYPPGLSDRMRTLIEAGDRDEAVSTFFRDVVKTPEKELHLLRSLPVWKARVAAAHTIVREMELDQHYQFHAERFERFSLPTLLLLGADSPALFKRATETLGRALATSRMVLMPGQQHTAMNTAPDLFVSEVLNFLSE